jgi:KDO2-lipid IV(A) lauroyltransferase
MLKYAMFRVAEGLSRAIPRPFAYWISLRVADLYFFCDRRGRGAVSDNLRRVMEFGGQAATPALVRLGTRRTFQHFGKYVVDFFRFARLTEADIRRLVKIDHPEYVEQSLASRKGVILVTAHLGNWELGGAVLAGLGYPVNAVVLEQRSARLNEFFQHYRRRRGMAVIPLGHAVPQLIRALRRNECVALLADRDYSRRTDFATFCGALACLPRGPAWLAEKTGAPVVPGFLIRRSDETFELRLYAPIEPAGKTAAQIQREICVVLEDAVSRNPDQWFMFERVWDGQSYGQASNHVPAVAPAGAAPG